MMWDLMLINRVMKAMKELFRTNKLRKEYRKKFNSLKTQMESTKMWMRREYWMMISKQLLINLRRVKIRNRRLWVQMMSLMMKELNLNLFL
jgi:hypothetical protein